MLASQPSGGGGPGTDPQLAATIERDLNSQQETPIEAVPQSPYMPPVDTGAKVPVQDNVGNFGTLPVNQVADAVNSGRFKLATPEQLKDAREREWYNSGGMKQVIAGAAGGIRGATLGGSDVAFRHLSPETADELEKLKKYYPITSMAGEVGGMIIPALLTGGAGAAAEGAGGAGMLARGGRMAAQVAASPMRGLEAAGAGVEGLVGRGLAGLAEGGLGARTAATVIPKIANQATQGAIIGAGQYFSEAALGDKDIRAQELLASAGGGALIGGLFGGGLGLLGAGGRETSRFARRAMLGAEEEGGSLGEMLVNKGKQTFRQAEEGAQGIIDSHAETSRQYSISKKFKSSGGTQKQIKILEDMPTPYRDRAEKIMFEEVPRKVGLPEDSVRGLQKELVGLESLQEDTGNVIGRSYKEADHYIPEGIDASKIASEIRDWSSKNLKTVAEKDARETVNSFASHLENNYALKDAAGETVASRVSLTDLHNEWSKLKGKIFNADGVRDTILSGAYADVRHVLQNSAEKEIGALSKKLPNNLLQELKAANQDYTILSKLIPAYEKGIARAGGNRTLGLGEHLGAGIGSFVGSMFGGPVGTLAGGAVGAAGGWATKHFGDAYTAEVAHMMSKGARISDIAKMTQQEIRRGVSEFVGTGVGSKVAPVAKAAWEGAKNVAQTTTDAVVPAVKSTVRTAGRIGSATGTVAKVEAIRQLNPAQFSDIRHDILKQHADPSIITTKVLATGLQNSHPGIAQSLVKSAAIANEYLFTQLPVQATRPSMNGPVLVPPTQEQLRTFEKIVKAIDDPISILDDLRSGNLSPQIVMAVKTVYPGIYNDIETQVRIEVAGKKNMPYSKKMALGLLLGSPVDPTLTVEYLQAMRAASSAAIPQKSGGANKGPTFPHVSASKVKQPPSLQTRAEKIGSK
jgi:hypothetical protein